jgi:ribonuclease P protein component
VTPSHRVANLSFPKARRLTRSAEFAKVRTEGRSVTGKLLVIGVLEIDGDQPARVGFITSKRVGGAVIRNRVRRRLREVFRLHQHEVRSGVWIVTIARAAAANASFETLKGEWLRLARSARLLNDARG